MYLLCFCIKLYHRFHVLNISILKGIQRWNYNGTLLICGVDCAVLNHTWLKIKLWLIVTFYSIRRIFPTFIVPSIPAISLPHIPSPACSIRRIASVFGMKCSVYINSIADNPVKTIKAHKLTRYKEYADIVYVGFDLFGQSQITSFTDQ